MFLPFARQTPPARSIRLLRLPVLAVALAAAIASTACVPLVVGSAAVGGTLLVLDRRTSGAQLDDEGIEVRSHNRISKAIGNRGRTSSTSFNRVLLLTGQVYSEADRAQAEAVAREVPNVRSVVNKLAVQPTASLVQRTADSLITSRVKAALLTTANIHSNDIKVVTELGTVYLMGIVSNREAELATQVARNINGVLKVVTVFEIVPDTALPQGQQQTMTPVATTTPPPVAAEAAPAATEHTTP